MRKIFSLLTAILFAGSMMADSFAPKALADITADDVVIVTIDNGSGVYALANDKGTSAAPTAVAVTVTDGKISSDATNILWTLTKDGDNLSFAAGESNLYCTNTNNGVRVGSSTGTFIISNDYLCCTSTSSNRYLGVYNSQDWRCYTTINSNIQNQTLAFYVKETEQGGGGDPITPPAPEHTYTVAGSSAELFGTAWTPSDEANDMTLVEGLYTWEKTDLTLAAGIIEFKVCEDHAWTTAYPAQNYQLNIPEAGIYTVTITFNAETKEVAAVATKTGSAVVVPTVAMHGNFLGSWADTENFAIAEGNATASLTLNIEAGDYEFGMRIGGSGNWTANGVSFTRENPSAVIVAGSGNLKLAADKAGEYTFTWTYETNTLAITFPTGTGIQQTNAEMKAVKMIENGQIVIIKNGIRYNVLGAVISK